SNREPCVWRIGLGAPEAIRRNADDRVRLAPDAYGAAQRGAVTPELPLPESVAEHRQRRPAHRLARRKAAGRVEHSAEHGSHAKKGEESVRDECGAYVPSVGPPDER